MKVAVVKDDNASYSKELPYHPSMNYPEYPFRDISNSENRGYELVRDIFFKMRMDRKNYNSALWNPLGEVINPKDNVLIKPNFVRHYNKADSIEPLLTHGSIIRAMLDYVYIALGGQGRVTIADAPLQDADFEEIISLAGIIEIISFYKKNTNFRIDLIDLRRERAYRGRLDYIVKREKLNGDPLGYTAVDLGSDSELFEIRSGYKKFRVTQYDKNEMLTHHNEVKNEYLISNSVLSADVIINLPKLKTHRKAGMTAALKNLVGINGCKDWLPHHRCGSVEEGGDEYLYKSFRKRVLTNIRERIDTTKDIFFMRICRLLYFLLNRTRLILPYKDPYFEGSWYGNDTIPRVITDLNKIVFYADKNGELRDVIQRKMFVVTDAIIAGEKEGPLAASAKHCGFLIAGFNPVAVDLVCSAVMGFDYRKIQVFKYALASKRYKMFSNIDDIEVIAENSMQLRDLYEGYNYRFIPARSWKGHIEFVKD